MASEGKRQRANARAAKPAAKLPPLRRKRGWTDMFSLDADQSSRLLVIGGVAAVVIIAAGFLAFGYWNSVIKPRNRTVLAADGYSVSYSAMKRRMQYEYFQSQAYQQQPTALPIGTYQTLLNEITVIAHAESDQGVKPDDGEVDSKLHARVGAAPDADTKTFADAFRRTLDAAGLHENEYRRLVLADVLTQHLKDKFTAQLPAEVPQAKLQVIATADEDVANQAEARVKAGEDWATVAKDVSTEVDKATTGGLHDFAPQGTFNIGYDDYAFSAPVGQISDPLQSTVGSTTQFFVVQVLERKDQALTDNQKPAAASRAYQKWLEDQQSQMVITNKWDSQAQQDALLPILVEAQKRQKTNPIQVPPQNSQPQQQAPQQPAPQQPAPQQPPANPQPDTGGGNNPAVPNVPVAPGGGNVP